MSKRVLQILGFTLLFSPLAYLGYTAVNPQITEVKLWNGNKTSARQVYEKAVITAALDATRASYGEWQLLEDIRDLPFADEEAGVFRVEGFDVFGTVAGNPKLENERKHLVPVPIMKGLLGYRLLIIRAQDQEKFAAIESAEQLKQLTLGIPATWADAELFRQNGYSVNEGGSFDDLFVRLALGEFDYVAFGANEIDSVWQERAASVPGLVREQELLLVYPFPVVFYVNPTKTYFAERLTQGLEELQGTGKLDAIFYAHHGNPVTDFKLDQRRRFDLSNPQLPAELKEFQPSLTASPNEEAQ